VAILRRGRLARIGAVNDLVKRGGVEIVLRPDGVDLPNALRAMAAPPAPTQDDDQMRFVVESETAARPVLRAALDSGAAIISVNPRRETLEELFVRLEKEDA
jgi:ABC-2 type transport system ATP-binding protein